MKSIVIILSKKSLYILGSALACLFLLISTVLFIRYQDTGAAPASGRLEEEEIKSLEKENTHLEGVLNSILPEKNQLIIEDRFRNQYKNAPDFKPPAFKTYTVREILKEGKEVNFEILSDYPSYLRPLYDPSWKETYYRGWLDLTTKNIEARHRLFIYPGGGSSIYDFIGSLGFYKGAAVDYHRNINFLLFDFTVDSIKWYKNQAVILGEPQRRGSQVISVLQDDMLNKGVNTKDMLFHLCTPGGYELDFIHGNVINYAYLKKKIEENTVRKTDITDDYKTIEQLIEKNLHLKKELSYFIPTDERVITQEACRPIPPYFPYDGPDIGTVFSKAATIEFKVKYSDKGYLRPVYDPQWLKKYRNRWCYLPQQICSSLHTLFPLPGNPGEQKEMLGALGFNELFEAPSAGEYTFLIYNTTIDRVKLHREQLFISGTPGRTGAVIISISKNSLPGDRSLVVRLVTPDYQELDYAVTYSLPPIPLNKPDRE